MVNYKLLTPGPLTTTDTVKREMLADHCTWDDDYKQITQRLRAALLELGVEHLWTGHCTGPAAFALLKEELGARVEPLTGGMRLGI